MTGMFTGAKNNTSQIPQIKSDSIQKKESITSETFIKSAEKIYYRKMSKDSKNNSINKEKHNSQPYITSYP